MLHRPVVGVDGSPPSDAALRWTVRHLASGGSVHLVHGTEGYVDSVRELLGFDPHDVAERIAAAHLDTWTRGLGRTEHSAEAVAATPADAILDAADRLDADAVVVGVHSHRRWAPHHVGSIAAKLLHRSSVPVVVVPAPEGDTDSGADVAGEVVVVGVDGADGSEGPLAWGVAAARAEGLPLRVVWVLDRHRDAAAVLYSGFDPTTVRDEMAVTLHELVERVGVEGVDVEEVVPVGYPEDELLELAADASLLVVGRRPIGAVGEYLTGSTSRWCVARAGCPVAVVPTAARRPDR
ncbi:MAG: universal stress protein [Acidimicrobiales bacterium]|nr:universal stress protein [Acidimicrobiales bacterium]